MGRRMLLSECRGVGSAHVPPSRASPGETGTLCCREHDGTRGTGFEPVLPFGKRLTATAKPKNAAKHFSFPSTLFFPCNEKKRVVAGRRIRPLCHPRNSFGCWVRYPLLRRDLLATLAMNPSAETKH